MIALIARYAGCALAAAILWSGGPAAGRSGPEDEVPAMQVATGAFAPLASSFLQPPRVSMPRLSPSGAKAALYVVEGSRRQVEVLDIATGESKVVYDSATSPIGSAYVGAIHWKSERRLVLELADTMFPFPSATAVADVNTGEIRLVSVGGGRREQGRLNVASAYNRQTALADPLLGKESEILVVGYERGTQVDPDLYRVDLETGRATVELQGHRLVQHYYVDREGRVVARLRALHDNWKATRVVERLDPASGEWSEIFRVRYRDLEDAPEIRVFAAAPEPGRFYVLRRPENAAEGPTDAVHVYDFANKSLGPALWRHPAYDAASILLSPDTGAFEGACYVVDVLTCDWLDARLEAEFNALVRFFDGERNVSPESRSRDGTKWILLVSGPDEPGTYYLYDRAARKVDVLESRYPMLNPGFLGTMRRVDYQASDGTDLHGYLTVPPRSPPGYVPPLVVMPHGGPEIRDVFDYDPVVQFLASRGYAVFQPNFRGSSGFGRAFAEAGYGEWGGRMQQDVLDGVDALIARGLADPARMCVVGASYGGYVALRAATATPDRFRCVVSVAGVADLIRTQEHDRRLYGADSDAYAYWVRSVGDPRRDRDKLMERSPVRAAAAVTAPILLVHGDQDRVVSYEESVAMERALREAGKSVEFLTLRGEGHRNWSDVSNMLWLTALERFLDKHLPMPEPDTWPAERKTKPATPAAP